MIQKIENEERYAYLSSLDFLENNGNACKVLPLRKGLLQVKKSMRQLSFADKNTLQRTNMVNKLEAREQRRLVFATNAIQE